MIILPFLHFFCFLACTFLAVFVLYKDPKSILNRTCFILMLCFALWNFGDIIIQNPDRTITKGTVIIMQNIASIGWLGFASAIFCFSIAFSKREKLLKKKWFLFFIFILPLFFVYKQWTNCLTINPIRQSYGWSYSWTDTIWTYLFYVYYFLFTLLSIYFIYFYGRKTKKIIEKNQAKIITFSVIASLIIGTIFEVVIPELGIYNIPALGNLVIFIFAIGLFYAIIKYRFLTITPAFAAENIISVMNESLILLNQYGNIISVNKATLNLLQYEQKELEGKSVTMLFLEDNFKKNLLEQILKGEVIKNHDSKFLTKNGVKIPITYSSSPLINGEGIIMGTVFIAKDITERKLAEELLRESFETTKTVLESMPIGVIIVGRDKKIRSVNGSALKMMGAENNKIVGEICHQNICPAEVGQCPILDLGKTVDNSEKIVLGASGIKIPVLKTAVSIILGGEEVLLEAFIDITERKKEEEELIRAKGKAEESDRLKTAFLQNISHEIRTPLNAIIGFSELLQDTTSSQEDSKFYLEQIHYGTDDLLDLIEDVMFASKIVTKQFISVKKEFNLNDSLNNLVSNSKKLLKRKDKSHLDFLTHIESTKNITIEADGNNLNIALRYLIDNAIKYTDSGEIEIGTKLIDNSEVEFYIRDTGPGIDKSEFEKIFDKFYKVEANPNKLFRGAGIGLTIVKGIAEISGGKVWVDSIVGKGSTFYYRLPVNVVKSNLKHYEPEEDISKLVENWGERNILIAEDVDTNLKYLDKVLDFRNITRYHAKNGLEAVEIVKTVKIDLVLMDILMPLMDGYEAATIIKTFCPSIPIIAQTAIYYNHNNKDSNLLDLFNDYLVKPISPNSLIEVLDKFLKTNKYNI